MTIILGSLESA